ncbi:MAG: ferritin-like domain-containing protein [Pseudomonadota bacterium]|nr:ferritin-like domain-containing protein [Pseudomonadota bacterium]
MSTPTNLQDLYIDELKDLWSANDQMQRVVAKMVDKPSSPKLKSLLTKSEQGIAEHTGVLKDLLTSNGGEVAKEHCKGMAGLVEEAKKHVLENGSEQGPLLDALIIAQYQRMTHYGIAGFGTAAAYADALGRNDDAEKLHRATKEIYRGDEYASTLAETSINIKAENS